MCIKGRFSHIDQFHRNRLILTPFRPFWPEISHYHRIQTIFVQKWLKPCHRMPLWFHFGRKMLQFLISASLIAMKKVSPSQSPSPSATEDTKSTQNSNMYSIQAQNSLLPNIIGKLMASETFTSLIWVVSFNYQVFNEISCHLWRVQFFIKHPVFWVTLLRYG